MSATDLRDAFNSVAPPRYTCERAYLGYERAFDLEWQVLKFSGKGSDGNGFEVRSEQLRPGADLMEAARATAQALLNRQEPIS